MGIIKTPQNEVHTVDATDTLKEAKEQETAKMEGTTMRVFNINYNVRIRLTPAGVDILKQKGWTEEEIERDQDGYLVMQMWKVMAYFGAYMTSSCKMPPFDVNILIDDECLETR